MDDSGAHTDIVPVANPEAAANKTKFYTEYVAHIVSKVMGFYTDLLRKGGTGWLAGTPEPTIADFVLVPRLEWLFSGDVSDRIIESELGKYPAIAALINKFNGDPKIKAYYAKK